MFFKKPKHRIFDYEPRFYKSEEDTNERRKRSLKFRSARKIHSKKRPTYYWAIFLIIVAYVYLKLAGVI